MKQISGTGVLLALAILLVPIVWTLQAHKSRRPTPIRVNHGGVKAMLDPNRHTLTVHFDDYVFDWQKADDVNNIRNLRLGRSANGIPVATMELQRGNRWIAADVPKGLQYISTYATPTAPERQIHR